MSKGRRYEETKKLNIKKVFAVIIAIIVMIMSIFIIKKILEKDTNQGKIISKDYFAVYQNNKWGVIDSNGNIVIDPAYNEMIIIPNSKKDVFLCTYDVDYNKGTYKTKALNSKNEEIFQNYEQVEAIQNQDENNNIWYEKNVLKVKKDSKYGMINLDGKEVLPSEYDEITSLTGTKEVLKISKNGKYGIIDDEGKSLIKPEYKEIESLSKDKKDGFIIKNNEEKYGLIDISNEVIIEPKYDKISKVHKNDLYVVEQGGKEILIKKDGTEILNQGFDHIHAILKNTDNGIIYQSKNKYGVMKLNGEKQIEAEYEDLIETKSGIFIAKKDGKYGVIDSSKNEKIKMTYKNISYSEKADIYITENDEFNNEIIDSKYNIEKTGILVNLDEEKGYIELRQEDGYHYYNFKFEEKQENEIFEYNTLFLDKKDGKYGFKNKAGEVVVDYNYDDATKQNQYGYAGVKKDGKWGVVDKDGTLIQEPTYNLDDYLKIDFIGRWHLGKDLNMNYYNQL